MAAVGGIPVRVPRPLTVKETLSNIGLVVLYGRERICPDCWGRGFAPSITTMSAQEECWTCDGWGKIVVQPNIARAK